jgi:hypothetical protein
MLQKNILGRGTMRFLYILSLLTFSVASNAAAITTTIDFQEFEHNFSFPIYWDDLESSPYDEPDYQISSSNALGPKNNWGSCGTASDTCYAGSTGLFLNSSLNVFLGRNDDQRFTLESIELAFSRNDDPYPESSTVTFYARDCLADEFCGSTISQSFTLYKDDPYLFKSFELDSRFADVLSVSWSVDGDTDTKVQFDNIVVTAVPVPAAIWLFGSALAGMGWMRRRKTA